MLAKERIDVLINNRRILGRCVSARRRELVAKDQSVTLALFRKPVILGTRIRVPPEYVSVYTLAILICFIVVQKNSNEKMFANLFFHTVHLPNLFYILLKKI